MLNDRHAARTNGGWGDSLTKMTPVLTAKEPRHNCTEPRLVQVHTLSLPQTSPYPPYQTLVLLPLFWIATVIRFAAPPHP
jgi:hypothetical protein